MRIDVLTVMPQMFAGPLEASILGSAQSRGLVDIRVRDLRDWTHDRHRTTDDSAFGGGPGMVMKPEPFFEALDELRAEGPAPHVVLLTPQGRPFSQRIAEDLAGRERLVLLCGRYEGFDERVRTLADEQISIGDYVLTGGELPALVVIDAVARLLPGVLGHADSAAEDSFSLGLLEYPQYTRPASYRGLDVPEVLLSGDHARVDRWRRLEAVKRTALARPELLADAGLTPEERELAAEIAESADPGTAEE